MIEWIIKIIENVGYVGVALLSALEVVIPIIPSEIILPFSGFASSEGNLNFIGVLISATIGSVAGALIIYYVAIMFGWQRIDKLVEKFGKYIGINPKDIDKAGEYFDKYEYKFVLFGRFLPGVRSVVAIPAGLRKMHLLPFVLLTLIGSLIWNIALIYAGYVLGENYDVLEKYISPLSYLFLGLLIIFVTILVYRIHKKNEKN